MLERSYYRATEQSQGFRTKNNSLSLSVLSLSLSKIRVLKCGGRMEHSEEISVVVTKDPSQNDQNDAVLGFQHSPSSNGDPGDPPPRSPSATSDLGNEGALAKEEGGGGHLHDELGNLDLKENEEEKPPPVPKSDSEEKDEDEDDDEERVFEKGLSGGEIGSQNGSEDGSENENGKEEESDGGEEGGGGENKNDNEVNNGGNGDGGEVEKKNGLGFGTRKYQYPVRPEAEDCSFYLKTGTCKFGSNCKFNHPVRRKTNQVFSFHS